MMRTSSESPLAAALLSATKGSSVNGAQEVVPDADTILTHLTTRFTVAANLRTAH